MNVDYADIVEGCRRRDRRAEKDLYDAFAPMAMGVCMRYMHDRTEAQDVMQDGFVKVYEKIGYLKDVQHLQAWIYKVMVNECLMHFRRRNERMTVVGVDFEVAQMPLDPFGTEEVVSALQQLPAAQRTVFNLVEVEGYSHKEVAHSMHCTEVNVRALLSRAKQRLREILTDRKQR